MSLASQELPPQILQVPVIASVLRDLEGLFPVTIGVALLALFEVLLEALFSFPVRRTIFSTRSCIVMLILFKRYSLPIVS